MLLQVSTMDDPVRLHPDHPAPPLCPPAGFMASPKFPARRSRARPGCRKCCHRTAIAARLFRTGPRLVRHCYHQPLRSPGAQGRTLHHRGIRFDLRRAARLDREPRPVREYRYRCACDPALKLVTRQPKSRPEREPTHEGVGPFPPRTDRFESGASSSKELTTSN